MGALWASKKFKMALIGLASIVFTFALAQFTAMTEESAGQIVKGIMAIVTGYLVGQGIADQGKEAAKVAALPSQDKPEQ